MCASSLSRGTKALGFLQPPSVEPRRSAPEKPAKKIEIESEMHMSSSPTKVKFLEKIGVKICTWTVLQLHRRHLHSFLNLHEPKDEWEGSNQISVEEILGVFRCSRQIRGSVIKMLGCSHHISGCSQQKFTKPVSIKQLHVTINQLSFCANRIICIPTNICTHTRRILVMSSH